MWQLGWPDCICIDNIYIIYGICYHDFCFIATLPVGVPLAGYNHGERRVARWPLVEETKYTTVSRGVLSPDSSLGRLCRNFWHATDFKVAPVLLKSSNVDRPVTFVWLSSWICKELFCRNHGHVFSITYFQYAMNF